MVQVLKEETAQRILDAARDAFYSDGFKGATMRGIADGAGIPVGLVYSYYDSKLTLFDKVVLPVRMMLGTLLDTEETKKKTPRGEQSLFEEVSELLGLFKTHRKEFLILSDKSAGTPYESFKQEIIEMTTNHIKAGLEEKLSGKYEDMDDFIFHILASNFTESVLEIARHWKGEAWAAQMLNLVAQQYFYGVNSF